jgi:hypothetical protein
MNFVLIATIMLHGQVTVIEEVYPSFAACIGAGFNLMDSYPRPPARVLWNCESRHETMPAPNVQGAVDHWFEKWSRDLH